MDGIMKSKLLKRGSVIVLVFGMLFALSATPTFGQSRYRRGTSTKEKVLTIGGGTAAGAIIGAIAGGKKGAVIGGLIGAGAGTGFALLKDRRDRDRYYRGRNDYRDGYYSRDYSRYRDNGNWRYRGYDRSRDYYRSRYEQNRRYRTYSRGYDRYGRRW